RGPAVGGYDAAAVAAGAGGDGEWGRRVLDGGWRAGGRGCSAVGLGRAAAPALGALGVDACGQPSPGLGTGFPALRRAPADAVLQLAAAGRGGLGRRGLGGGGAATAARLPGMAFGGSGLHVRAAAVTMELAVPLPLWGLRRRILGAGGGQRGLVMFY